MKIDLEHPQIFPHKFPAKWKSSPEDFYVEELWTSDQKGAGEHVLILLEKKGQNTEWVAKQLARFCGVRDFDVGLMGLKDRNAVTRQWMSVYLGPRQQPDWERCDIEGVRLLEMTQYPKKLRRGDHNGNFFRITLRDVEGDKTAIDSALNLLKRNGFPNYFGEQRFGRDGYNLTRAGHWFVDGSRPKKKSQRALYASAARSHLFNLILGKRVEEDTWTHPIEGDELVAVSSASVSSGGVDQPTEDSQQSLQDKSRLCPSGPLLGGSEFLSDKAGEIEKEVTNPFESWITGLHSDGMRTQRRPFLALAENLSWEWSEQDLQLEFGLGVGSFASVLLGQIFTLQSGQTYTET